MDECGSSPCVHGSCSDFGNSYVCECDGRFTGPNCDARINGCNRHPCIQRDIAAQCVDTEAGFACSCSDGYSGVQCTEDIDDCVSNPCENNGACFDEPAGYFCLCMFIWSGENCEEEDAGNLALDVVFPENLDELCRPAFNEGLQRDGLADEMGKELVFMQYVPQVVGGNPASCACRPGFQATINAEGTRFESWVCLPADHCASAPCGNNGECDVDDSGLATSSGYTCLCEPGFAGGQCDIDIDECGSFPCVQGQCVQGLDADYYCMCSAGWVGDNCHQNVQECKSQPCMNGAMCGDEIDGYRCYCRFGYAGSDCSIDLDECASSPCRHGSCVDGANAYNCICSAGWGGANCADNIDDCQGAACFNGAACVDHLGGYTCACADGFRGDNCALETDECMSSPCLHRGLCIDETDSYSCSCAVGWEGDNCDTVIEMCDEANDCAGDATAASVRMHTSHIFRPACVQVAASTSVSRPAPGSTFARHCHRGTMASAF